MKSGNNLEKVDRRLSICPSCSLRTWLWNIFSESSSFKCRYVKRDDLHGNDSRLLTCQNFTPNKIHLYYYFIKSENRTYHNPISVTAHLIGLLSGFNSPPNTCPRGYKYLQNNNNCFAQVLEDNILSREWKTLSQTGKIMIRIDKILNEVRFLKSRIDFFRSKSICTPSLLSREYRWP